MCGVGVIIVIIIIAIVVAVAVAVAVIEQHRRRAGPITMRSSGVDRRK